MTDYAALVREAREAHSAFAECFERSYAVGSQKLCPPNLWVSTESGKNFEMVELFSRLADAVEELSAAIDLEFGGSTCSEPLPPIDLSKIETRPGVPGVYAEVIFDQRPVPRESPPISCRFETDEQGNIRPVFECERGDSDISWKEPKK